MFSKLLSKVFRIESGRIGNRVVNIYIVCGVRCYVQLTNTYFMGGQIGLPPKRRG